MFEASRPSLLFDYFRVPYRVVEPKPPEVDGCAAAWLTGRGPEAGPVLLWPDRGAAEPAAAHRVAGISIFARVVPDPATAPWRQALGGAWRAELPVADAGGRQVAAVWRNQQGSVLLPFDPGEVMEALWSEAYLGRAAVSAAGRAKRLSMRAYYRARPALPRSTQIALRRAFSRVQARTRFPRWPAETALHDLYDLLLGLVASVAGEPLPTIAPWPHGKSWALVLTHDVETAAGLGYLPAVRDVELACGCRSAWNLVPRRYAVDDGLVAELKAQGFEVGVHGLYHDGFDLASLELLQERLPEMRAWAERWGASGFRSPATHRRWEWMPLLGFDHDSSYSDTDPFEPQGGGCCTWLPFFIDDLVELPITLVQDHTLFVILRRPDETLWVEKVDLVRRRGGMALLDTHPDYLSADGRLDAYRRLLAHATADPAVWCALPSAVSSWWRRRAASRIESAGVGWRVVGPAAGDAAVALVTRDPNAGRPAS
ncbi:MAG TPA: hypothetical protein VHK22_05215 [Gaiellaceae bacterium]|nr:hypothetical protein [Gaiellaceae bacterium]